MLSWPKQALWMLSWHDKQGECIVAKTSAVNAFIGKTSAADAFMAKTGVCRWFHKLELWMLSGLRQELWMLLWPRQMQ